MNSIHTFAERIARTDLADVVRIETAIDPSEELDQLAERFDTLKREIDRDTAALRNEGFTTLIACISNGTMPVIRAPPGKRGLTLLTSWRAIHFLGNFQIRLFQSDRNSQRICLTGLTMGNTSLRVPGLANQPSVNRSPANGSISFLPIVGSSPSRCTKRWIISASPISSPRWNEVPKQRTSSGCSDRRSSHVGSTSIYL